jgi:hypothetical protein
MDPMERLIAADPVSEAERLSEAEQAQADLLLASILAEDPAPAVRERRRPRSWMFAVAATACALAAALLVVDLADDEGAPGPSVVDRAVAAVTDEDAIYHMVARIRIQAIGHGAPRTHEWGYIESWYGPNHTSHTKGYELNHGHRGRLRFESADQLHPRPNGAFGGEGDIYDPLENTITHSRVGRSARTPIPTPDPNSDPGEGMRRLERDGRLHLAGSQRFAGRKVYRLVSGPVRRGGGVDRYTYLVDADDYYPVYFRWVSSGGGIRTLSTARYLTYEPIPFDAQGRKLLDMDPHPGAKVIDNTVAPDASGGSGGR